MRLQIEQSDDRDTLSSISTSLQEKHLADGRMPGSRSMACRDSGTWKMIGSILGSEFCNPKWKNPAQNVDCALSIFSSRR